MDFEIIDMKAISEAVRESMKTEDGDPFEGDVPVESVEKEVADIIFWVSATIYVLVDHLLITTPGLKYE